MSIVVCYEEKSTGKTYLAYYTFKSIKEAQKEIDKINAEKPEKLWNGELAKCDERTYFVTEQKGMV